MPYSLSFLLKVHIVTTTHPFSTALLHWFQRHGRSLPWRETKDPYAIWLSEVILQQTRVSQGMAYWLRFMQNYPTVNALAAATEDEVLRLWQGLGYYSRARNLHQAAKQIAELGHFPNTHEEISKLKGVGPYTSAAIASIAFNLPVAVVDGNVYRVLARFFGIDTPINSTEGKKQFATLAQSLLPHHAPARYNEAIMDFGALQCLPVKGETGKVNSHIVVPNETPSFCNSCPLSGQCVAFAQGLVRSLPVKTKSQAPKQRRMGYIYIRCGGEVAIRKRPAGDIWQGLWEPLLYEDEVLSSVQTPETDKREGCNSLENFPSPQLLACIDRLFKGEQGTESTSIPPNSHLHSTLSPTIKGPYSFRHVLTHRIIMAQFAVVETSVRPDLPSDYIWVSEHELNKYAISRLFELFLERLNNETKDK